MAGHPTDPERSMRWWRGLRSLALVLCLGGCARAAVPVASELLDLEWVIVAVDGSAVEADSAGRAPTLLLRGEERQATGLAGCNRFSGAYRWVGDSLSFGPLAMTRMFCEGRMELESRYGQALTAVTTLRLVDGVLELLAGDRVVLRANRAPSGTPSP